MSMTDCVQRILSKKLVKGEKATEQDLAMAHSECKKEARLKTAKIKISKLNTHAKLLSAKLNSIRIGKILQAKKKQ